MVFMEASSHPLFRSRSRGGIQRFGTMYQPIIRQYRKNIGRTLEVNAKGEKYEGVLSQANEEDVVITWKAREPKPVGKGKVTVQKAVTLPYQDITEAKVKIKF